MAWLLVLVLFLLQLASCGVQPIAYIVSDTIIPNSMVHIARRVRCICLY